MDSTIARKTSATAAMMDAMLSLFCAFLKWARGNATDFYKLASKLLLRLAPGGREAGPVMTRIKLVAPARPLPSEGDRPILVPPLHSQGRGTSGRGVEGYLSRLCPRPATGKWRGIFPLFLFPRLLFYFSRNL